MAERTFEVTYRVYGTARVSAEDSELAAQLVRSKLEEVGDTHFLKSEVSPAVENA